MAQKRIPTIIDCDTGTDDALALVLACISNKLDLRAVTTVAGNVALENTTRNTLNVLHFLGRGEVPVAAGADAPLSRKLMKASGVHGLSGLRGYSFENDTKVALQDIPAWDLMKQVLEQAEEKVTIIALGPTTNLAILLDRYPEVKSKIDRIVFMGTSYHDGNPTPIATFNVLVDPEAFRKLLFSGIDIYACPLETTRKSYLSPADIEKIRGIPGKVAEFTAAVLGGYGNPSAEELALITQMGEGEEQVPESHRAKEFANHTVHDLATVACVTNPELFTWSKYYCDVECSGELTTGFTLIDMRDYYGKTEEERNLFYIDSVQREAFVRVYLDAIAAYNR